MDLHKEMQEHGLYVFLIKFKPLQILSFKPLKLYL